MKKVLFLGMLVIAFQLAYSQTHYYSSGNHNVNDLNSWWSNTDGTGTHPANFSANNQIFNVQGGHLMTASGIWNVTGTGSKVIIKSNGQITSGSYDHTLVLDMESGATWVHSNTSYGGLTFGTLDANSTFQMNNAGGFRPTLSYPNLVLNFTASINPGANGITVTGNLTIKNNAALRGTTSGNPIHNIGGAIIIETGGTWITTNGSGTPTYNIGGDITNNGTIAALTANGTATINLTGTATTLITWGAFSGLQYNLNLTTAENKVIILNDNMNVAGTITVNGTFIPSNKIVRGGTFTLNPGAALNIRDADGISLTGDVGEIRTNTRNFSTSANYTYQGSGSQSTGDGLPPTVANLHILNSEPVILSGSVEVTNFLIVNGQLGTGSNTLSLDATTGQASFEAGSTLHVDIGGIADFKDRPVILKSSAIGTARVAEVQGTLTGVENVTIERYIGGTTPRKAWRLLGVPLMPGTGQSINASWQEGQGAYAAGYGTHITNGEGNGDNGYDNNSTITSTNASIKFFDGTDLVKPANTTGVTVTDNAGAYFLYIRGDRNANYLTNTATAASNTVLRVKGTLASNNIAGMNAVGAIGVGGVEYTLVRNPYPSNVDFEAVRQSNFVPTYTPTYGDPGFLDRFYVWDANLGSTGAYRTVERIDETPTYQQTPSGGSPLADNNARYIQQGSAFWIPTQKQLFFYESMKSASSASYNVFRETSGMEEMLISLGIKQTDASVLLADGVRVKYLAGGEATVNSKDAIKMINFSENLSIFRGGKNISIEQRPTISSNDTIFLRLWNVAQGNYQFTVEPKNFSQGIEAFIQDLYLNTVTPIDLSGANQYAFSITGDMGSQNEHRFRILFRPSNTLPVNFNDIKAYEKGGGNVQVEWKVSNESNIVSYAVEESLDGNNFIKAVSVAANGGPDYNWLDINPVQGNNYYRVKSIDINGKTEYTQTVNVKIGRQVSGVRVYPNPVRPKNMIVQLENISKGPYQIALYNSSGQLILTKSIQHSGGSAAAQLRLPKVATGTYFLELKGAGTKAVQSIIIQ